MSDDSTAEKALQDWAESPTLVNASALIESLRDQLTSRDTEVAELRRTIATRDVQIEAIKEVDDAELRYRDDVEIPALEARLAEAQATIGKARGWDAAHTADNGETSYFGYGTLAEVLSAPSSTGGTRHTQRSKDYCTCGNRWPCKGGNDHG